MWSFKNAFAAMSIVVTASSFAQAGLPFEPLNFTPTIVSDVNPFVIKTDFETGVVVYRDDNSFNSPTSIFIQHLKNTDPSSQWGVGDVLPNASTVASLTIEMAAVREGDGFVAAVSGTNDQDVEFFALLRSEELLGPLNVEYALMADDQFFANSGVTNPRLRLLMLAPNLSIFPQTQLKGMTLDPLNFYGMIGLVESLNDNMETVALPFAVAHSRIMSGMTFYIPPSSINMGVNPDPAAFTASCRVPTITRLPGSNRSFIYPVSETAPAVHEQIWNYPGHSNIGNLEFNIEILPDQTSVTTVPVRDSWIEWARNDTLLYSKRSIERGAGDPFNNLESVDRINDSAYGTQSWSTLGSILADPTSPIPGITLAVMWFSGPVDLSASTVDMAKGDADGNGEVERDDALAFFSFFSGLPPRPEWDASQADMDGDSDVDFVDRELFAERLAIADFNAPANEGAKGNESDITYEPGYWNPGIGFVDWFFATDFPRVPNYASFGGVDIRPLPNQQHLLILSGLDKNGGFNSKGENALLKFDPSTGYKVLAESYDPQLNAPNFSTGRFFESLSSVDERGLFTMTVEDAADGVRTYTLLVGDIDSDPINIPDPPSVGPKMDFWLLR